MKSKHKRLKARPLDLTITVQRVETEVVSYFLTNDNSGKLYTFQVPFDQEVDLSNLVVGAQYHVKTAVNYRGSYLWTEVRLVRLPASYKASSGSLKSGTTVGELFDF
jgi:hypothetical protein